MRSQIIYYTYVETPVGPFLIAGREKTLSMASFFGGSQRRRPEAGWIEQPDRLAWAVEQIEEYFAGGRQIFDLALEMAGTTFQKEVWRELRSIPFGEVRSYGDVARQLGRPGASRAVGAANAANVIPLIVPCHRVVGSDGRLTGFGGGLETKEWLLDFEGARLSAQQELFSPQGGSHESTAV